MVLRNFVNDRLQFSVVDQKPIDLGGDVSKGHQVFEGLNDLLLRLNREIDEDNAEGFQGVAMGEWSRRHLFFQVL